MLIIIGQEEEIHKMVDNNRSARRYSCLKAMLCEPRSDIDNSGPSSFPFAENDNDTDTERKDFENG